MDKDKLLYWISLAAACVAITIGSIAIAKHNKSLLSSPVEEIYHRQLVVTIDSILDARFGAGCCEEYIDTVNANTFNSRFGGNLSPMD